MAYNLFLFDADDTLFDFSASEHLSLVSTFNQLGLNNAPSALFDTYKAESRFLWAQLERGKVSKDFLKVERFRKAFARHGIDLDPERASTVYLETLPETVVLVDHALEICEFLRAHGEIGIITNGIEAVQRRRLSKSSLGPFISFMGVSESCGFAKPDVRFFEHSVTLAKSFAKDSTLVIGDRLETDILGAAVFGVDACLFNPGHLKYGTEFAPRYEIAHLSQIRGIVSDKVKVD